MRHLIVMRHAKAERGENKSDYQRELEPRGWKDAGTVGAALVASGLAVDHVICSAARRTRDTLCALLPHIEGDCTIHLSRALYDAEVSDLRDAVRRAEGQTVLLIGHNPAVHGLALALAGGHPEARRLGAGFPTSHAAVFSMGFAIDTVRFERLVTP